METLLSIDTIDTACSVALWHQGQCFSQSAQEKHQHHKLVLPMIQNVLKQAGVSAQSLSAISMNKGPGSFVGSRISAALIQGLAYRHQIPIILISHLQLLAYKIFETEAVTSCYIALDAKREALYFAHYEKSQSATPKTSIQDQLLSLSALETLSWEPNSIFVSNMTEEGILLECVTKQKLTLKPYYPLCAPDHYAIALEAYNKGLLSKPNQALPCYIRGAEMWKKSTK